MPLLPWLLLLWSALVCLGLHWSAWSALGCFRSPKKMAMNAWTYKLTGMGLDGPLYASLLRAPLCGANKITECFLSVHCSESIWAWKYVYIFKCLFGHIHCPILKSNFKCIVCLIFAFGCLLCELGLLLDLHALRCSEVLWVALIIFEATVIALWWSDDWKLKKLPSDVY